MAISERAFYQLDTELRLISASEQTLVLWGKSRREIIGRKLTDLFPFAEGGDTYAGLLEALQTFRPVRVRTHSIYYAGDVDVEIYPVPGGLQVSFERVTKT